MLVERKSEALTMLGSFGQFSHATVEYLQLWNDGLCAGFPKHFYIFKILPLMAPRPDQCPRRSVSVPLHSVSWDVSVLYSLQTRCLFILWSGNVSVLYSLQTWWMHPFGALANVNGKILSEVHFSLIYVYMWYLPFPTSKVRSSLANFKSNPMVKIMFTLFPLPALARLMPWLAAGWIHTAKPGTGPAPQGQGPEKERMKILFIYLFLPYIAPSLT